MTFRTFAAVTLVWGMSILGTLLTPVEARAQSGKLTLPMEKDAAVIRWSFEGYGYGEMTIAIFIAPVDNKVAVCGVYAFTKRLSASVRRSQLAQKSRGRSSVWIGETHILDGLRRLRKVSADDLVAGTPSPCVVTRHAWSNSYSNEMLDIRAPYFKSF